jgi:hypothetical protein
MSGFTRGRQMSNASTFGSWFGFVPPALWHFARTRLVRRFAENSQTSARWPETRRGAESVADYNNNRNSIVAALRLS